MQQMAAALTAAMPGDLPAQKVVSIAQRLGAVYDGHRWRFPSPDVRRTVRRAARAQGVRPPEPLEVVDLDWEAEVKRQEARRRLAARERVETRFRFTCANGGRQALIDGKGQAVARLVEADLTVTPETLAWLQSLPPDLDIFPVEAHVPPQMVKAAAAGAKRTVGLAVKSRSKFAALETKAPLDLETPVAGVVVPADLAAEALGDLTPKIHRRAEIKRQLVGLWRAYFAGTFPERCPENPDAAPHPEEQHPRGRWARLAWFTFVGHALPPVYNDARRWDARKALKAELAGTGLEVDELCATLTTARRVVPSETRGQLTMALTR